MKQPFFAFRMAAVAAFATCVGLFTACQKPEPTTVAVTGVSLDKSSLSLQKGASETLTATVSPANASNKSVSWKSSDIGVYQGGFTFFSGIWRPTRMSVMNSNYGNENNYFNAPSRAQIYTRAMKLSEGQDWQFDYEAFVTWDRAHPTKSSASPVTKANYVEMDDAGHGEHVLPVITNKTWRQVLRR